MQNTKSREVLGEVGDRLRRQVMEWTTDEVRSQLERVRIINTWDNRYRIDFFCRVPCEYTDLPKRLILDSRFCHLVGDELVDKTIKSEPKETGGLW